MADVDVHLDVDHPYDGDLDIYLLSPSGTRVELSSDNGGDGDHYHGTIFDDEASMPISGGTAPFTGRFQPEEALATLKGEAISGTWTLIVADDTFGDTGSITGFALDIQTVSYVCLAVTSDSPTMLGDATTFNATVHSSFDGLEWQFGDASALMEGSELQVSHTYANTGDYMAKVSAILFAQKVSTLEIPVSVVFGSPASLDLSASPLTLSAQLDQESTLSVTVRDSNGNLVPNQPVTFSSSNFGTLNPERATTNSKGVATSRLSNPDLHVGSTSIRAQAGEVSANSAVNFGNTAKLAPNEKLTSDRESEDYANL